MVKDRTFLGGHLRLVVAPEIGPVMTIDVTTGAPGPSPKIGDLVHLDMQPSDARVLMD